jgi:PknH-like extracellular domain
VPGSSAHLTEDDLSGMLVAPGAVAIIVGTRTLSIGAGNGTVMSTKSFVAEGDSEPIADVATRQREMTGPGQSGIVWVRERVTWFPDPAGAAAFVSAERGQWGTCAGQTTEVERHGAVQQRILGAPGIQDDILAISDAAPGSAVNDCAQAIGAKSNVVIRADVCGAKEPTALGVVAAVRDKIPND